MYDVSSVQYSELGPQVAAELRRLIVSGAMAPGTHLVETAIAETFDVSRGPVRDAFKLLQSEGLVEVKRRSTYVRGLSDEDISELYSLRQALESLAMQRAAEQAETVSWAPFERVLDAMLNAADRNDAESYAAADVQFHTLFYEASGHHRLQTMWNQLLPTFRALLQVTISRDADLHPSAESHERLLRFCRERRFEEMHAELTDHLVKAHRRLTEAYREVRDTVSRTA